MFCKGLLTINAPILRQFSSSAPNVLKIGDVLSETRVFTTQDVVDYAKVSHDSNPLHFDSEVAQNAGFEDRLVHGMLVASLFPRIISSYFPGAVYVSQSLQFRSPVYVGDEILGEIHAINLRETKKKYLAKLTTKCFKNGRLLVLEGEALAILPSLAVEQRHSLADNS
ncbi:putative oxidoreductase [Tripterygium wilfordii]|uniref:Putative oxidoreductase n=1 Tax=Tripterygium wilfordii TaxID=458696 RepID=A0A7J7C0P8_TRIWF|nr:(R)-specific enoyl-CoA hydratase [Tripterygium wilfordii]XP_038694624.1 (R)-specific enoyl-CoA hydratase [Tripterygium wilfordii]XP_038694625.1 (R)-specific enoyl-CoA hydratase [Tripterygium wilfordii]XP_038694626.1 (R)-specific enoyl-CoA hydratase [Tripterygium wilfordii]KAF5727437.1 putative oxidoreductase [Tripterygium wilfordii]